MGLFLGIKPPRPKKPKLEICYFRAQHVDPPLNIKGNLSFDRSRFGTISLRNDCHVEFAIDIGYHLIVFSSYYGKTIDLSPFVGSIQTMEKHLGKCFCGHIQIEVKGAPEGMGYCHCSSCRSWSAAPVNAFTLWKPEAVSVIQGADKLKTYEKTEASQRQYCSNCGGHVMTRHDPLGLVDVYAASIPSLKFEPGVHVNYSETVLPFQDGLPKLKDFPAELGGSGETVPE